MSIQDLIAKRQQQLSKLNQKPAVLKSERDKPVIIDLVPVPKIKKTKKPPPEDYKIQNGEDSIIIGKSKHGKIGLKVETNDLNNYWFDNLRMIITGQSGSGKSYLCRNLIEKCYKGRVGNTVIFDPQGETISLREQLDFVIFGKEKDQCDVVINKNNTAAFTKIIIEKRIPSIIDFFGFDDNEMWAINCEFIKTALTLNRTEHNPTLLIWEEAHVFAKASNGNAISEQSKVEMKKMAKMGRKLDYSLFYITQRITDLHIDIQSQLDSYIIGKNQIKSDVKRCSELIFTPEDDFRNLKHEFYAYGSIFDHSDHDYPIKFKSLEPKSQYIKGFRYSDLPKNDRVKKMITFFAPKFLND